MISKLLDRWGPSAREAGSRLVAAFGRLSDRIARRRRATAISIIAAAHLGLLAWIAMQPPVAVPDFSYAIDVSLDPGLGGASAIGAAPSVDGDKAEQAELETPPPKESEAEADEIEPAEGEAAEIVQANEPSDATPPPAEVVGVADPIVTMAAPPGSSPDSAAVLAMVEAIIGVKASDPSFDEAAAQAAAAQSAAPVLSRAGQGGGCAIEAVLQARIVEEPALQAALAAIPREVQSVANAIQLWDGAWTGFAPESEPALALIRAAIVETIDAAPAQCRHQEVVGPRFVVVSRPDGATTVVVVGSGSWKWADISPDPKPAILRWLGFGRGRG